MAFIASVTGWSEQTIRTMPLERLAVYVVSCQRINGIDIGYKSPGNEQIDSLLDALDEFLEIKQKLGL